MPVYDGHAVAGEGSHILVNGGTFTSRFSARGGFIYAKGNNGIKITGGLIVDNIVSKRGGAVRAISRHNSLCFLYY